MVGAVVDPLLEALATGLREGALQELAVLEQHDLPAQVLEQAGHLHEQAVGDHRVEALAVVVDDPPAVLRPCFQYSSRASCTLPSSISASPMMATCGPWASRGSSPWHAHSPAPGWQSRSRPRRDQRSPWRNRRRRYPWCATDRTGRRRRRGNSAACRGSGGRTGTGWHGTPGWRAASPPRDPPAAGHRSRAPSSASRPRPRRPGARPP